MTSRWLTAMVTFSLGLLVVAVASGPEPVRLLLGGGVAVAIRGGFELHQRLRRPLGTMTALGALAGLAGAGVSLVAVLTCRPGCQWQTEAAAGWIAGVAVTIVIAVTAGQIRFGAQTVRRLRLPRRRPVR